MEIRNPFRFIRLVSVQKLEYQALRENQNPHGEYDNSYICKAKVGCTLWPGGPTSRILSLSIRR